VADHDIRAEIVHRHIRVTEGDCDHRDPGVARRHDIGAGIPHHDGPRRIAARPLDGQGQVPRIRLEVLEGVTPAIGRKAVPDPELVEQLDRVLLDLVRADRQEEAGRLEAVERCGDAGKKLRPDADVLAVCTMNCR